MMAEVHQLFHSHLQVTLEEHNVPVSLHEGIIRYIEGHIRPGGFLRSVIVNDLLATYLTADKDNLPMIENIVRWFHAEAPGNCWGSEDAFRDWINSKPEASITHVDFPTG